MPLLHDKKIAPLMLCWPLLAVLTWLAAMAWVWNKIGASGVAWGLPLSALITLPVAATFLWLDSRGKKAPRRLQLSAFAWGASVAGLCSIWSQNILQIAVDTSLGAAFGHWFRPLVITPVTEEVFKGIFLVWILLYRRAQLRGMLDGIVYAGLVGAGFAFSEQTMYFGQIVNNYLAHAPGDATAGVTLLMSFVLRALMLPFMHAFFVAFTGLGIAAAAATHKRSTQVAYICLGFLASITLHGVWDWGGLASGDPYMIYKIYAAVMLPLFLIVAGVALVLRKRGRKVVSGV